MGSLTIKIGASELNLQIEGDDFKSSLDLAVSAAERLALCAPPAAAVAATDPHRSEAPNPERTLDIGINSIVAKMGGDSARDILRAAATHLSLVDGFESFPREKLLSRAHEARDWQASYNSNQARDLKRMVDQDELVERTGGLYALPSKALAEARLLLKND